MFIYFLKFIAVFLSTVLSDIAWTYYFIRVEERKAGKAGFWASCIVMVSAFITVNYVEDHSLLIAAVIGSYVGTWISVKWNKKEPKKEREVLNE
jgi:hypothetical protein